MTTTDKPVHHTLWTGGLDSTARIVELSRRDAIVQPYYILDGGRKSTGKELKAIARISERLRSDPATRAELRDVEMINEADIAADAEISQAFRRLSQRYGLGSQYDFLARFAAERGIMLELGIENIGSKLSRAILSEGGVVSFDDGVRESYRLAENATDDCRMIFGNYVFPLWGMGKKGEVDMMARLGCADVVDMTWFCHLPLAGLPCGHCNPCKDARSDGFAYRLSRPAYYLWYVRDRWQRVAQKFRNL